MNTLRTWCKEQLSVSLGYAVTDFMALSGDASFRKYHRLTTNGGSFIAVYAPPATEKNREFLQIARILADAGLRVPEVIAADLEKGFLLQTDLGDTLLLGQLNNASVDHWYNKAMRVLLTLQKIDAGDTIGQYSAAQMREDLQRFPEWFVENLLGHSMSNEEHDLFDQFCQHLLAQAARQPQRLTHYDYQSRNLMVCADNELGIIDFQDALLAPITYDLVSLLRDCYVKWPQQSLMKWVRQYAQAAHNEGLLPADIDDAEFKRWFDYMSLQRHVRVLGTFARLYLRDDKPRYLSDIPLVCDYVREVAAEHDEMADFSHWFEQQLMPKAVTKTWYKPSGPTK